MSYQTIKDWNDKFGDMYANEIRRRRARPTRRWHVDEAHVKIRGKRCYLWRAVDDNGIILDVLVTERRNKEAARCLFGQLVGSYERPTRITTDRLRSYKSVVREQTPRTKHIRGKWLNNRSENSHIPVSLRERQRKEPPCSGNCCKSRFEEP